MTFHRLTKTALLPLLSLGVVASSWGAKLVDVRVVDDETLMITWQDGIIEYKDDASGPNALMGHESGGDDTVRKFDPPLSTAAATALGSYTLTSTDDRAYSAGLRPKAVNRRAKVNGTTNKWPEPPFTLEHTVFLRLPRKLQQGKRYTLRIAPGTNTDATSRTLTFDAYKQVSEAIHVNLIGYNPDQRSMKSADLYMWLGDGGARDYSSYSGRRVVLVDTKSGAKHPVGKVAFWRKSGTDFGNWNLTRSDVWNVDFSAFSRPGRYRLAVEGIGCSPEFDVRPDVYFDPFQTSVLGFYYMRIGEPKGMIPPPRQPRFIPGEDPKQFRVYRTTFGPWHPDWKKLGGDVWDRQDWSAYKEPGEPTNPNAWGGHSDALDWDRHAGHISIIYDMLLPFVLTNGKIKDDNLKIRESGNGLPDLLDEARYEVDFWLRLRDGKGGYAFGLNNPGKDHLTMYQAAARPYMAWANAANCAMLADCYRLAGKTDLMAKYRDAAIEAYKAANGEDLDFKYGIGNGATRGRDLKMLAAAYLYNLTGERAYEDAMAAESLVTGPTSEIDRKDEASQYWGTAAYLMCAKQNWRPIHHPELLANMRAAIRNEAMKKNVANSEQWPSRRSSNSDYGWFQSTTTVQALCIAHAVSTDVAEKERFQRALILEADYSLGRNPLNMVLMTGLGSRSVQDIYTSGRNDGYPGVHPGHTPYMNANAWGEGYMADPQWYAKKGYPTWDQWPHGEALWRARYSYANNEFTPQQTMGGKTCLLGYLYGLGKPRS